MSRLVSVLAGLAAGIWLTIVLGDSTLGAIVGTYVLLLFELPRSGAEKRRLRHVINGQYLRLKDTGVQIGRLNNHLHTQNRELLAVRSELERRDSVGAPEARKLIESQRETLQAQARAMEEAQRLIESQELMLAQFEERTGDVNRRWDEMIITMQNVLGSQEKDAHQAQRKLADESGRLTEAFAEQSREMQRTMGDLLHRLALEPRTSNVSVQDSVLVSGSEDVAQSIRAPMISERPSRTTPKIPELKLKARPIFNENEDNWIEAFNVDFA
ncbi:MAG TPA: hypothetical protein QF716_02840 [Candidatus Thalassarchaeaceae archaeon]|jgi:gas vesicle protein|nr:hypothetical protein [Candidatus Thalassarchaeaceae archaeon]HJM67797.1 hypothetical protein [Candidatus Thalassarchaeaceae archaeon]